MPTLLQPVPPSGQLDPKWLNNLQQTVNYAYAGTCTTATRPSNPVIGMHSFDTTLGVPIWCKSLNPPVWVNGVGTVV